MTKKHSIADSTTLSRPMNEIPTVDWLDLDHNREKFMRDLRYALSECGFLVLANAPGLDDDFQQRACKLRYA